MTYPEPPPGYRWKFTSSITLKNGTRIFASWYGKKAFCFLVRID